MKVLSNKQFENQMNLKEGEIYTLKRATIGKDGQKHVSNAVKAKLVRIYTHIILFEFNGYMESFTKWETMKLLNGAVMR